ARRERRADVLPARPPLRAQPGAGSAGLWGLSVSGTGGIDSGGMLAPTGSTRPAGGGETSNLADVLERVLDKGVVIAGDIQINLLDIELLTIKLRLVVASVDKAKEMGIDWWEHDPALSSRASDGYRSLAEENKRLRAEIEELREGGELP